MSNPSNLPSILLKKTETATGLALIITGVAAFLDQYLKTGWLSPITLPLSGVLILVVGIRSKSHGFAISGSILTGIGIGIFSAFIPFLHSAIVPRLGMVLAGLGIGWYLIIMISHFFYSQKAWWALVPGGVFCGLGICFIFSDLRVVDFFFYVLVGLGSALLLWGGIRRLQGLIIPGCILLGIGLGLYMAWGRAGESSSLARTGIMLVWFALGWGLITLFDRINFNRFIWWPLIPGGVLFMVGLGLYLGGNPGNAVGFIRNTGSISLIIFGLYLLLMRRGMRNG
jgi:hypothetical protein